MYVRCSVNIFSGLIRIGVIVMTTFVLILPSVWQLLNVYQDSKNFASPENITGLSFGFSSNSMSVSEEVYIYPTTSFMAEAGGALGLFLGFNFMMVWDFIEAIILMVSKKIF